MQIKDIRSNPAFQGREAEIRELKERIDVLLEELKQSFPGFDFVVDAANGVSVYHHDPVEGVY